MLLHLLQGDGGEAVELRLARGEREEEEELGVTLHYASFHYGTLHYTICYMSG